MSEKTNDLYIEEHIYLYEKEEDLFLMCNKERFEEIINNKEDLVEASGAQIQKIQSEGDKIEKEVMELTKKISFLL